jgi:hypothetical protein
METQPIGAREVPPTETSEPLQQILQILKEERGKILNEETLKGNDPKQLNAMRKELSDLGDAIQAFLKRGNTKPLEDLNLQTILQALEPLVKKYKYKDVCMLCDVVDTLFKQAPFTPNPSHALLLQKNIANLQNGTADSEI